MDEESKAKDGGNSNKDGDGGDDDDDDAYADGGCSRRKLRRQNEGFQVNTTCRVAKVIGGRLFLPLLCKSSSSPFSPPPPMFLLDSLGFFSNV